MPSATFDRTQLLDSIKNNHSFAYTFMYVDDTARLVINKAITAILDHLNRAYLRNQLHYMVMELLTNAHKAVVKRARFLSLGLNINDPADYEKGMVDFSIEYEEHQDEYVPIIETQGLSSRVEFRLDNESLSVVVSNTGIPTIQEQKRIQERIDKSKNFRTTAEAMIEVSDETEGAGLGTVMLILMLRALSDHTGRKKPYRFCIDKARNLSVAEMNVPINAIPTKVTEQISDKIAGEIESIPSYPENVMRLEKMIRKEDVPLSQVASIIDKDPALTTELLKVINSAAYVLPQEVKTIQNAVSLVGIRGIRSLLLSFGAQRIMNQKYGNLEHLWKHAYKVAFYAYSLAREKKKPLLADDAYIGGILHDIGKIILNNVDATLSGRINAIATAKGIPGVVFERLAHGCTHARVGARILKKWNFPESIINPVEFSYQPLLAPVESREVVELVYLADSFAMLSEGRIGIAANMEPEVLKKYGLDSATDLSTDVKNLAEKYQRQLEKET